ncbi:MAG: hypothetical protein PHY02_06480 [Phycisphaerae bacterium]|nr:hypothetical protein [Phycisphaerae bacterium]
MRPEEKIVLPADKDIKEQIKKLKEEAVAIEFECHDCGAGFGRVRPDRCPKCRSFLIEEIKILKVNNDYCD